ncbi:hypothetical protein DE146DRAFT_755868 [Phaeosphaeria sp. MPI-PUGE-AT-0046c]|nr:hypothetical protein DE146DRAFT_755868 [Phaeosphaeria sp. MPI-PUGE-AT-0046c]
MPAPGPDASVADKIKWSLEGIERPSEFINTDDTDGIEKDVSKVDLKDEKELSFEEKVQKAFFDIGGPHVLRKKQLKVEDKAEEQDAVRLLARIVHPAEETAGGSITDKVAKESSDSTASSHSLHDDKSADAATSGGNAHANAHKANPGPVHADNLPTPESKEDLKKRAEELNK